MSEQMQALVIKSPEQVEVVQRPIPEPKDGMDVVVKVELTALCGSDLHIYRGHPPMKSYDFILVSNFIILVIPAIRILATCVLSMLIAPYLVHCRATSS
jgi:hypothetical protein